MHAIVTGSTGSYDMSKQYEEGWFVPITYVQEDKIQNLFKIIFLMFSYFFGYDEMVETSKSTCLGHWTFAETTQSLLT